MSDSSNLTSDMSPRSQAYGLTETNAVAVMHGGMDYLSRPSSTGCASPINELAIVRNGRVVKPGSGEDGEIWMYVPFPSHVWRRWEDNADEMV